MPRFITFLSFLFWRFHDVRTHEHLRLKVFNGDYLHCMDLVVDDLNLTRATVISLSVNSLRVSKECVIVYKYICVVSHEYNWFQSYKR